MKTRFYFIRHGETEWNTKGIYQGLTDIPLSEKGEKQAEYLGKRFQNKALKVDAIYSSPLQRAVKTAESIANAKGLTVIPYEYFKEINFGEWEGHTVKELTEKYGQDYTNFYEHPFTYSFPGEGSFESVKQRSVEGFYQLLEKHKGQAVAIVSHGGVLRVLIMALLDMDETFYRKTWLSNTAISIVDVSDSGKMVLLTLNDFAHLEAMEEEQGEKTWQM